MTQIKQVSRSGKKECSAIVLPTMRKRAYDYDKNVKLSFTYVGILNGTAKKPVPPKQEDFANEEEFKTAKSHHHILENIWSDMTGELVNMLSNNLPAGFWESRGLSMTEDDD